jgi:hypothetical protein
MEPRAKAEQKSHADEEHKEEKKKSEAHYPDLQEE